MEGLLGMRTDSLDRRIAVLMRQREDIVVLLCSGVQLRG
jgi:hypothetical protein